MALGALAHLLAAKRGLDGGDAPALVATSPGALVRQAIGLMKLHDVSQLPVMDGDRPVGAVTEYFLTERALESTRFLDATVGEVMDEPRGDGVRRAVGDLVSCPFCSSVWVAGALVGGYAWAPRATRLVCAGLGAVTLADWLQYAWSLTERRVEG